MAYDGLKNAAKQRAIAEGAARYMTGKPCSKGHVAERYVKNSLCVECSNSRNRFDILRFYESSPEKKAEYRRNARRNNAIGLLVRSAKQRAKARGLPFSITRDDLTMPASCPCCGRQIVPNQDRSRATHASPSLDRVIPALGYVPGNVEIICWRCNDVKADASAAELRAVADWLDNRAEHNVSGCAVRAPIKAAA